MENHLIEKLSTQERKSTKEKLSTQLHWPSSLEVLKKAQSSRVKSRKFGQHPILTEKGTFFEKMAPQISPPPIQTYFSVFGIKIKLFIIF